MNYRGHPITIQRDPVRAHLMQQGTFHGFKGIQGAFIPISPAERDRLCEILEREARDIVCINCGCTKSDRWLQIMGIKACCDIRDMVPAHVVVGEIHDLREAARRRLRRGARKAAV